MAAPTPQRTDLADHSARDGLIREPECARLTGLSRSTRWRLERVGQFPPRRRISPGCSAWLRAEVLAWIASR
jgi:prophage regulatory protein